jgi:hypothetical protein
VQSYPMWMRATADSPFRDAVKNVSLPDRKIGGQTGERVLL